MKKIVFVIFLAFVVWGCESPKEDKVRLAVLKSVYDEKWGICNRALYAQEKAIRDNGQKDAEISILKESQYYRDSILQYLEKGKTYRAKLLVTKGLTDKKLNALGLIPQMNLLDSAYVAQKDSTSLLYAEISIVTGLAHILADNDTKLGTGF